MSNDTPTPGPKSEFRRSAVRIFELVIIVYVLFVLAAAIFQCRLIYFPRTIPPALAEPAAAELGFVPWDIRRVKSSAGNCPPPLTDCERFDHPRQCRLRD